jgi:cytochrome c
VYNQILKRLTGPEVIMHRMGRVSTLFAAVAILAALPVAAGGAGTREAAAKAMVEQGIRLLEEKGAEEMIRTVNQRKKPFTDGELYLFVIGPEKAIVAHGSDGSRIGIAAADLYDHENQPYGHLMLKLADEKGKWIPYNQFNPLTKKVEPKRSWIRRANGYIVGCGVYGD